MVLIAAPNRHIASDTESPTQKSFVDIAGSYHSKNIANPWWCVHHHFGQRPPAKGAEHHLCPSTGRPQECHRAAYSAQSFFILHLHSRTIQVTAVQDTYIRREQAPNMVNYRVHMAPFSMLSLMSQSHTVPSTPPHEVSIPELKMIT